MPKAFLKWWPAALFAAALAVALCIFSPAFPALTVLRSPDFPADLSGPGLWRRAALWLFGGNACLGHDELLRVLVPPLAAHTFGYALDAALQAVALAVFLRLLGLSATACCGGGLAIAFAGYNFTLFNAGHRGYADMMPYGLFMLALCETALRRPRWTAFALLAACAVCGLAFQPDVMTFVVMLVAARTLFALCAMARREGPAKYFAARWRGFAAGALVLAAAFAALGAGTLRHVLVDVVRSREAQIAGSSASASAAAKEGETSASAGNDPAEAERAKRERWIFATNWSLPPEDVCEAVAPDLHGMDTGHPVAPYWGRIGRSVDWAPGSGGLANYRQHSLYVGAPVVALALFALVGAIADRKSRGRGEIFFWSVAAAACILLALGRHGPVYRAFYALPWMDRVRAPVKFYHLFETCVAVLFAFGLQRLADTARAGAGTGGNGDRASRLACRAGMTVLVALAAVLAFASAFPPEIAQGLAVARDAAARHSGALVRGAVLVACAAALVGAAGFAKSPSFRRIAACVFPPLAVAAATIDLATVDSRYVTTEDHSARAENTAALADMLSGGPPDGAAWSYLPYARQPLPLSALAPLGGALDAAGFVLSDPFLGDTPQASRVKTAMSFGNDIFRNWAFWGVRGVFIPPDGAAAIARAGMADVKGLYDFSPRGTPVRAADPRRPRATLVSPRGVPPPVGVWHDWKETEDDSLDSALAVLSASGFDMRRTLAVHAPEGVLPETGPAQTAPEPAAWVETPLSTDGRRAKISAEPAAPGLLFVRENRIRQFWPSIAARVNGAPAPVVRANGMYLAVPVPAGKVEVEVFPRVSMARFLIPAAGWAFVLFALVSWARTSFREDRDAV